MKRGVNKGLVVLLLTIIFFIFIVVYHLVQQHFDANTRTAQETEDTVDVKYRPILHNLNNLRGQTLRKVDFSLARALDSIYGFKIIKEGEERWGIFNFGRVESFKIAPIDTVFGIILERYKPEYYYIFWCKTDTARHFNDTHITINSENDKTLIYSNKYSKPWEAAIMLGNGTIEHLPTQYWTSGKDYSKTCFGITMYFKDGVIDSATIIRFYDADPDEYSLKSASPKPKQ